LRQAAAIDATAHVYSQIAAVYGTRERWPETLDALATAQKIDANYAPTYYYRGNVYMKTGHFAEALEQYRRALELQPDYPEALTNLMLAQKTLERQKALQQQSH
jgi:tetratricopeptide (TPR) repeat protein